eukprot:gene40713-55047_t
MSGEQVPRQQEQQKRNCADQHGAQSAAVDPVPSREIGDQHRRSISWTEVRGLLGRNRRGQIGIYGCLLALSEGGLGILLQQERRDLALLRTDGEVGLVGEQLDAAGCIEHIGDAPSVHAALLNGSTPTNRLNTIFNPLRFKGRASVYWEPSRVIAGRLTVNYVNGYDNNTLPAGAVQKVGAYTTVDAGVTFNIGIAYTTVDAGVTFNIGNPEPTNLIDGGLSMSIDILNLLDKDPPYVDFAPTVNGSGGYDATAANP